MLLAQAAGGGGVPAGQSSAAIRQPSGSDLTPVSRVASVDAAPILLAQADPGAEQPAAEQPAAEPAAEQPAAKPAEGPGDEAAKQPGEKPAKRQQSLDWSSLLWPMLAIGFLFYFLLIRPQRQEQRRRQEMLGGVKKNDRVVTLGGIYGVVTNVHKEADEVTIKVDETTNTKLRVTLASIARIRGDEPSGGASSKQ